MLKYNKKKRSINRKKHKLHYESHMYHKTIDISRKIEIEAIDLFCGAGGLSHGLVKAGINVVAGFDMDPACRYPFEANNNAVFIESDISKVSGKDLASYHSEGTLRVLAGCAPCQPFSTYRQGKTVPEDNRWNLLLQFSRLIEESMPDIITMENVATLKKQNVFKLFCEKLTRLGFHSEYKIVNCADYGIPQQRKRLVLLASRFGPISLIEPTHSENHKTVLMAIGDLPPIKAGEVDQHDVLHSASALSETNLKRIKASSPGGSWRDWDEDLVADCHKKASGKTYPGVYGRMSWGEPAPTLTTQFYGFGNGRFGHPIQDRGLSLREGAILQSFPVKYNFVPTDELVYRTVVGRLIGNAVPVELGAAIGRSILIHLIEIGVHQQSGGRKQVKCY